MTQSLNLSLKNHQPGAVNLSMRSTHEKSSLRPKRRRPNVKSGEKPSDDAVLIGDTSGRRNRLGLTRSHARPTHTHTLLSWPSNYKIMRFPSYS